MLKTITGKEYVSFLKYGIFEIENNKQKINDLNVFPVPDGDTGTNMLMTVRQGFDAVSNYGGALSEISAAFAKAAVFGARGNSGVIVSQFFKGIAESFSEKAEADAKALSDALLKGCEFAYASVSVPTEGTILTVLREASERLHYSEAFDSVDEAVNIFLSSARISLKNTPNLLPVLKKAGVVDSGGFGIVCFFEGVRKYLSGEALMSETNSEKTELFSAIKTDYSVFNIDTSFSLGYCTELLLQLTRRAIPFDYSSFKESLAKLGTSLVTTLESDKVKIHIHTNTPHKILEFCQRYGEFLSLKIENMSVQNALLENEEENSEIKKKFLYSDSDPESNFSVIAVARNETMQKTFFEMGADVVILSELAPSSQEFLEAFALTKSSDIVVFPNSNNSILASMQAASLTKEKRIAVLNSRSEPECYSALSTMDFDGTAEEASKAANDVFRSFYELSVYHAKKDISYGSTKVFENDFFALSGKKILKVGKDIDTVTLGAVCDTKNTREFDVITIFRGKDISEEYTAHLEERLREAGIDAEIITVPTDDHVYSLSISFE